MASRISVNRVTNANIYINGNSMLGKCEEFALPEVKTKTGEHKALGMVGSLETFAGFEKLEGKLKLTSYYYDVLSKLANPFKPVQFQARASMQVVEPGGVTAEVPVVCLVTATFKTFPLGSLKQHENPEVEFQYSATYVKQIIGGEPVLEFDVLANIYKVNGFDLLSVYRANTGA